MVYEGNLERIWKVREKLVNTKIKGFCSLQKVYLLCSRREAVHSRETPSSLGAILKDRICSLGGSISELNRTVKIKYLWIYKKGYGKL